MADSELLLHSLIDNVGVKYAEDIDSNYDNYQHTTVITAAATNIKGKEARSARKLAGSLWEMNGLHSPSGIKNELVEERSMRRRLLQSDSHSPVHAQIDGSKVRGHRRATSQKAVGNAQYSEVSSPMAGSQDSNFSIKTRLKDVKNILIASKELVKVLFRILSQEEQHSSKITLVSTLKVELDRARLQVDRLIQEQRTNCNQIDDLLKQFAEENAACKRKERERIRETLTSLAKEVEIERKLRKQSERLNKKLGKELADTKAHFSRAIKELEGERRAREISEQTCDELAREIGDERVEVEVLKREAEKAREEVEKERQMLQLADVLREERVQMKLAEAMYEYEEKTAALERMKSEVETYLKIKVIGDDEHEDGSTKSERKSSGSQEFLSKIEMSLILDQNAGEVDDGEDHKRDSGDSSELQSIELNMENKRSCKWSFACEENNQAQGDSGRASADEMFKGRRSLSEKIQWESICLQRKTSDGSIEWDLTASGNDKQAKNIDGLSFHVSQGCVENGSEIDDGNFKSLKPASKTQGLAFCQGSASPAISTGNSSRLREACSAILQDLALRRDKLDGNGWINIK